MQRLFSTTEYGKNVRPVFRLAEYLRPGLTWMVGGILFCFEFRFG